MNIYAEIVAFSRKICNRYTLTTIILLLIRTFTGICPAAA